MFSWVHGAARRTKGRLLPAFCCTSLTVVSAARGEEAPPAAASGPIPEQQVVVRGESRAARLRRSALAVEVVELEDHKRRSQDLGEVLVRSSSLNVQREGGLGSAGRYSLNGLSGDRVRFFIDGVPLEYSGYLFGVGNVPLNLLDRVEVYQGVVPIRFGADALGGAVQLVTDDQVRKNKLGAAYEFGSFATHRLSFGARRFFEKQKAFARASGFLDDAANDYPVNVQVFDDSGPLSPAKVSRFHDGYRGLGAHVALGLVDQSWADRLTLQGFVASYQREIQNSIGMTVPYGEVQAPRSTAGGNAKYAKQFSERARLDVVAGYSFRRASLRDVSHCRYDWYGRCFLTLLLAGEIDSIPIDRSIDEHTGFARAQLSFVPLQNHTLRLALTPTVVQRTGRDREIDASEYDALRAKRSLLSNVLGLEYEIDAGIVSSIVFGKAYQQWARSEERLPTGVTNQLKTAQFLLGAGDSLRVSLWKHGYLKASYEYAARLPSADERFGDGDRIPNQPYLQASASPYLRAYALRTARDYLELAGSVRYVHSFLRGWESAASDGIKLKIPSQTVSDPLASSACAL